MKWLITSKSSLTLEKACGTRGFNDSFNISENSDFRSKYDPFYIIL